MLAGLRRRLGGKVAVVDEAVRQRVEQLLTRVAWLGQAVRQEGQGDWSATSAAEGWVLAAINAVRALAPEDSLYRTKADNVFNEGYTIQYALPLLAAVLTELLADIDAGLVTSIREAARAEVSDDYLEQAEQYLETGHVGIAGSITAVVFEDAIRQACEKLGARTADGADLDQRISALKAIGKLSKTKAQLARGAAALRNQALHADWSFSAADVTHAMGITRTLIAELLGG
jgi:hypothetical protein